MTTSREADPMHVTIAYASPGVEMLLDLELPAGALLGDAVVRSEIVPQLGLDPAQLAFAVFGQRATRNTPLVDGDRVEITRPLVADPKQTRRSRAADPARRKPDGQR